ncbi:MAG TPA: 2Fe-2S iron-sulfur cluster-binding protein [Candidatus Bathyarchaeia archaeon]|nr:2Fe-2S iron-sulfur cluster-binding protein [Candidatus Bathyarchaeia archaeon]
MPRLRIDQIEIEIERGATVLDAAAKAGADIPTLCHTRQTGGHASCMMCVVKDAASGRMLPACSAKADDGMEIDTRGDEVTSLRRETLQMLLSEHVGDCEAPCTRICPASLDIPRMMRRMAGGDMTAAARVAKRALVFPATLGRICAAPCEKGCRRAQFDVAVGIRSCHAALGDEMPERAEPSGKTVAVIGAGLAGMSAAFVSVLRGHACRVYDERRVACSGLRDRYAQQLPAEVLEAEIASIRGLGAELMLGSAVDMAAVLSTSDAVIVACDADVRVAPNVFRAAEHAMPVRSVANGKAGARAADAFVRGVEQGQPNRRYNSAIGKLRPDEIEAYGVLRLIDNPVGEAGRCLGCDCRKRVSCKLRQYADQYGIRGAVKRHMARPSVAPIQVFGPVLFEPGKCIKCGICVTLCRQSGEDGVTFGGRGLDSRVELPPGGSIGDDLAVRCAQACPTGAMAVSACEETL